MYFSRSRWVILGDFKAENAPNRSSAVAPPQIPLGELTTTLTQKSEPLDIRDLLLKEEMERKERGVGKEIEPRLVGGLEATARYATLRLPAKFRSSLIGRSVTEL